LVNTVPPRSRQVRPRGPSHDADEPGFVDHLRLIGLPASPANP